jgi:dUTP pyrophosphatase
VKNSLEIGAGVIDSGFTQTLSVKLHNHSDQDFTVENGMRIAQILFMPIYCGPVTLFEEPANIRGEQGFGSSGLY